jgi:UDP-2-acetamido-2-deoxy-ribo-hexuluronate aminotransferase
MFAQYTVILDNRDAMQAAFQRAAIPSAVHYPIPLGLQPAYSRFSTPESNPVAQEMARKVMSLPMSADLTDADQSMVCELLRQERRK